MRRLPLLFCVLVMLAATAVETRASITVVDFDSLTGAGAVPNMYDGVYWGGEWRYAPSLGAYAAESSLNYVYAPLSFADLSPSFRFAVPTVFLGAFFSGPSAVSGNPGISVEFVMYFEGVEAASSALLPVRETPTWLAAGYSGKVDKVEVLTFYTGTATRVAAGFYAMDNATYASVPAPAGLLLSISGFIGLLMMRTFVKTGCCVFPGKGRKG